MKRICAGVFCILLSAGAGALHGEEEEEQNARRAPGLPRPSQSIVLCINVRVMENDRVETWTQSERQVTTPGRPVEIKILGANIAVVMQFTPYERMRGPIRSNILVVQGQIWMETPDRGIRYHASMQTIPVRLGEPVYFFPLGPVRDGAASIEMILTIHQYDEE
jgi:hypothetical protein